MSGAHADVLIAGAGPVGGVLAGLLGQRGLSVIVVEREPDFYRLPRAAHFDHEIMRIFQELGIADAVARAARVVEAYEFQNSARNILVRYDMAGLRAVSGWPASYLFHQPAMEQALRERLSAMPEISLRTGCRIVAIEANGSAGARAVVADADGTESIIAGKFLVGADGASSTVRQALGIGLTDFGFEKAWLVIDTVVRDETRLPQAAIQVCDPARPVTVMPMSPGRRRWEFMLLDGESPDQMLDDSRIAALLLAQIDGKINPDDITVVRKAVYVFHGLVAPRWRVGSVLLAGDAAHQMPPFMGQGLCSGLRDAANLAWKLSMVCRGEAPDSLLDTYQEERAPHVSAIIGASIEMGKIVCLSDARAAAGRDAEMMAARARDGDARGTPPLPPLRGGFLSDTPLSGCLFPQTDAVRADGAGGRLDDLLGGGFWLITAAADDVAVPSFVTRVRLGVDLRDDGAIAAWLDACGARAVLVRPDRVVFGTGEAGGLLAMLSEKLSTATRPALARLD